MARSFEESIAKPDNEINLAEAALLLAQDTYPDLDVREYLDRLNRWAGDVGRQPRGPGPDRASLLCRLNHVFFTELGFHGNAEEYYDPRNSYLNEVMDRRTGIPITLCVVYLELAWRVGLPLAGVGLPSHFIAAWVDPDDPLFIDVFNGGRFLRSAECQQMLSDLAGHPVKLHWEWLQPVSRTYILGRMLNNLKAVYLRSNEPLKAIPAVEKLLVLHPDAAEEERDLGVLYIGAGRRWEALKHLERYLNLRPEASDAEAVSQMTDIVFGELSGKA